MERAKVIFGSGGWITDRFSETELLLCIFAKKKRKRRLKY